MAAVPGYSEGVFHDDLRWEILTGDMTKWYQRHNLWDKIAKVRVFNNGFTISVRIKKGAKHTWRYSDDTVGVGGKIDAVVTNWYLVITNDRLEPKKD